MGPAVAGPYFSLFFSANRIGENSHITEFDTCPQLSYGRPQQQCGFPTLCRWRPIWSLSVNGFALPEYSVRMQDLLPPSNLRAMARPVG